MKKVCIDTNILIWYMKGQSTSIGQEDFPEKADYLFNYLSNNEIIVVIPSIVIGELLGNVEDDEERESHFDFISENFEIAQYDVLSARKYAELRLKLSKTNAKQYATEKNIPKCQITNDYNICSIAISSGCDTIFSHNLKDFEKFADHQIQILTLDYVDILKLEELKNPIPSKVSKLNPGQVSLFENNIGDDEGID
ncbi:MAG TPA: type II toxin-antitoxin system VapC family toxin [Flavobacterium sp.]|jgi:predicted nucleic acid-binding protein